MSGKPDKSARNSKESGTIRRQRKLEHLKLALDVPDGPITTGFEDIYLVHDAVPETALEEVELETDFLGKNLRLPLLINAMTGGIAEAEAINRSLAQVAADTGMGMAVGSQVVALEERAWWDSFKVVRKANPLGLVLANVSASTEPGLAIKAVDMLEADGLQVHLNVPQELAMAEGDRSFKGVLDNIATLVQRCPVPVIAKEVGFGLSQETATRLLETGVEYLDTGGQGGTNFVAIENRRGGLFDAELCEWGIPTAISLLEVLSLEAGIRVIASGGIRGALPAVKALALGASLVGIAGPFLSLYQKAGASGLQAETERFSYRLRATVLMAGARNLVELRGKPVIITGKTASWLQLRGIDVGRWARR